MAGCSATRPDALDEARENLERAQQDPILAKNGEVALYEARQSYARAEHAWDKDRDEREVEHLAYLTNQKIEIAREMAKQKAAEAETQRLAAERERVVVEARTREAEAARRLAESRGREADAALDCSARADASITAASTPTPTRPHLGGGGGIEPSLAAASSKDFLPPRSGGG